MSAWWNGLSLREKALVMVAGVLFGAFVVVQFLILPQGRELKQLREEHQRVMRDAAYVDATLATLAPPPQTEMARQVIAPDEVSRLVTDTARARGIAIARLTRGREGEVGVAMDSVAPVDLFAWLGALRMEHGVSVSRASISVNEGQGTVRANIEFGGRT